MAMAQADQIVATVEEEEDFGPMMLSKLEVCSISFIIPSCM